VSQAVEMTKTLKQRSASGLVNGVLQSLRRAGIGEMSGMSGISGMSEIGSHPCWLVERWVARYGEAETARLIEANNTRPERFIRPIGMTIDDALTNAEAAGIKLERVEHARDALRVVEGNVPHVLAAIPAIVQDPAAGLIARYAAPERGVIADLCAAPGGKALAMADIVQERGVVIAADVSASRLQRAIENAQRIYSHSHSPQLIVADARQPAVRAADLVLIDAPCTGTGTFRRHPDGKWRVHSEDLNALVHLQRDILEGASTAVKIGGILVYSTCSIEPEENQEQVSAFLDSHPNFLRRPSSTIADGSLIDEVGNLVVLPHVHGFDGAFAARLERVS